jgi:hypothetical protein
MVLIPATIELFREMVESPGKMYLKVDQALKVIQDEDLPIKYDAPLHRSVFEVARKDFLRALASHLSHRFENLPVVASLYNLLTPSLYVKYESIESVQQSQDLQKHLEVVAEHFTQNQSTSRGPRFSKEDIFAEWKSVHRLVWDKRDQTKVIKVKIPVDREESSEEGEPEDSIDEDESSDEEDGVPDNAQHENPFARRKRKYKTINKTVPWSAADFVKFCLLDCGPLSTAYPVFFFLMNVYLVIIISTAHCERIFSRLKLTKTALRNKLKQDSLEQLLHVSLNGPPLDKFIDSGMMEMALKYFFCMQRRNAKPPSKYVDEAAQALRAKLDLLKWGTSCKFDINVPEVDDDAAAQQLLDYAWQISEPMPAEENSDEESAEINGRSSAQIENDPSWSGALNPPPPIPAFEDVLITAGEEGEAGEMTSHFASPPSPSGSRAKKRRKRTTEADDLASSHFDPDPQQTSISDACQLRTRRTRSGRSQTHRVFLSYNHKDPKSVAMLYHN